MAALSRNDWQWLAGGVVGALSVPLLTVGVGFPLFVSAAIGVVLFLGVTLLLSPRRLFEGLSFTGVSKGQLDFARDLIKEGDAHVRKLRALARDMPGREMAGRLNHLAETGARILADIEKKPRKASSVGRFVSYYLPQTVRIAEGYLVLHGRTRPDPERLRELSSVVDRLDTVFDQYADTLVENELSALDVQLRLIDASLKQDIKQ
ncbi:5-bromo-4-chloroindolyl phosphate hydrolysis family protein [Pseudochelatococcus contaminans]|uniref:5-bromo-4-chloroindolyl phosphate hydrolysis protein n=1 Tax=Pseudochelatococcus contaminans TaxID=1538103 RepID=A0A7W5Z5N0_9HYPH|nr:5-bromo-4-chloroindolyl phosphate hydrolysis family protein [Pseudochelatococcus contaminans]MBB3810137.1 5-bromo-4-chloroindolyl phosphate hydrolysis protein [Pseudochelatococcus contaminans]